MESIKLRTLLPHQQAALRWALPRKSIALFMRMRLQKSAVFIRWAKRFLLPSNGCCLIIAPTSTLYQWQQELLLEGFESEILEGTSTKKLESCVMGAAFGKRFFLTHSGAFRGDGIKILSALKWEVCCLDESPVIKNPQSKTTKLLRKFSLRVPHKAILAGEPAPETPLDYFEQMNFLYGEFMGCKTYWQFRRKYFAAAGFDWVAKPNTRKKIKTAIREQAFILTEKQAGLIMPKIYETRAVELPKKISKIYNQVINDFAVGQAETKWIVVCQSWLAQLASGIVPEVYESGKKYFSPHKLDELASLISGELAGKQVVVFSRFVREIELAAKRLDSLGLRVGVIRGRVKLDERYRLCDAFQDGKIDALVCQCRTAARGLTLWKASALIVLSNEWDWLTRIQLESRALLPQKKEPTLIIDIVCRDTIDLAVATALKEKKRSSKYFAQRVMILCKPN